MNMNLFEAFRLQKLLTYLLFDIPTPMFILEDYSVENSHFIVELLYRLNVCNLIRLSSFSSESDEIFDYFKNLYSQNLSQRLLEEQSNPIAGTNYWLETFIEITETGKELVMKFFPNIFDDEGFPNEVNKSFIETIEEIFSSNGLAWENKVFREIP